MPWFKVDDGLHSHRKTIRAGIPAMGLWAVAGSWCADQLTDGWVPDYVAQRIDPDYVEHAASLVAAKFWVPGEKDGESGWFFHQWSDDGRQPTSESVNAKRDEARDRMAKLRAARAEEAKNKRNGSQGVRANAANMFANEGENAPHTPVEDAEPQDVEDACDNVRQLWEATGHAPQVPSHRSDLGKDSDSVRTNTSRTLQEVRSTPTRPDPTRTSYRSTEEPNPFLSATATPLTDEPPISAPKSKRGQKKPPAESRPDVEALCNRLVDLMVANGSDKPTVTDAWRTQARLLLDKDHQEHGHREPDKAMRVLEWALRHHFWWKNIRSIPKFRQQYGRLRDEALDEWKRQRAAAPPMPGTEVEPYAGGNVVSLPIQRAPRESATGRALREVDAAFEAAKLIVYGTGSPA